MVEHPGGHARERQGEATGTSPATFSRFAASTVCWRLIIVIVRLVTSLHDRPRGRSSPGDPAAAGLSRSTWLVGGPEGDDSGHDGRRKLPRSCRSPAWTAVLPSERLVRCDRSRGSRRACPRFARTVRHTAC